MSDARSALSVNEARVAIDGQFVNQRVSQVVQAIYDLYGDEIEVKWIPESARKGNEHMAAFVLVHNSPGQEPYAIFSVKSEAEFDERVLKKLIMGDQAFNALNMSDVEAHEAAQALIKKQEWEDRMEEMHDIAQAIIKSPLHDYRVNKNLRITEGHIGQNTARDHSPRILHK